MIYAKFLYSIHPESIVKYTFYSYFCQKWHVKKKISPICTVASASAEHHIIKLTKKNVNDT